MYHAQSGSFLGFQKLQHDWSKYWDGNRRGGSQSATKSYGNSKDGLFSNILGVLRHCYNFLERRFSSKASLQISCSKMHWHP